jgi:hypothetical protein
MGYLVFALLLMQEKPSGATVVVGRQESHFQLTEVGEHLHLAAYENTGYKQVVNQLEDGWDIHVTVTNAPLKSKEPGRVVSGLPVELYDLQRHLNDHANKLLMDQVALLFDWISGNIKSEEAYNTDQSLLKVIEKREGNCVGVASLAIFVLTKMGINARHVTGVALRPGDPPVVRLKGVALHRWVELEYPDIGWVFSDPVRSVNFVDATYWVIGVEGQNHIPPMVQGAYGGKMELVKLRSGFKKAGTFPAFSDRLRMRPLYFTKLR